MNYKNAFKCHKCPQRNDSDGCPDWWEIIEENTVTKESRIFKGCGRTYLPRMMIELIKANNRPAAEIGVLRHEIIRAVENAANRLIAPGTTTRLLESAGDDESGDWSRNGSITGGRRRRPGKYQVGGDIQHGDSRGDDVDDDKVPGDQ